MEIDKLKYPLGKFDWPEKIAAEDRLTMIETISALPLLLAAVVSDLSPEQLNEPYRDGGWSVRQVVHHLPDSHANAYIRFKLALTEDSPVVTTYREADWAELPDSRLTPVDTSLKLLQALHERWVILLRNISDEDFAKTINHPKLGVVRLDQQLGLYAWHGSHHIAQISALRTRLEW